MVTSKSINPYIGYENSSRIAKQALDEQRSVLELVEQEGLLSSDELQKILNPQNMIVNQI